MNTTPKIRPPVVPIASLTIEVLLSDEAQAGPIYSVSAVIEAMTDIKILNANIISTNKFEVFLPVNKFRGLSKRRTSCGSPPNELDTFIVTPLLTAPALSLIHPNDPSLH